MKQSKDFKYRYDEQEGIFVRQSEISVNWIVSQVLGQEGLRITKISNEDVQKLLYLLDHSDLRMPDGKHGLVWLKDNLKEKYEMATGKRGQTWEDIALRYRYIIEQIDFTIIGSENSKEIVEVKKEEITHKQNLKPNRMVAKFEPEE